MQNIIGNVKYLAFITPFFNELIHNQEILIDATFIGQIVDGAGFAATYQFLDNAKKDEGIKTGLKSMLPKLCGIIVKFNFVFGMQKNQSKKKLADNSKSKYNAYNPIEANSQFSFIDILWIPIIPPNLPFIFCLKTLQVKILELFTKYFHLHPLIPIGSGEFLSREDIWKLSTEEMYNFYYENDLKYVWAYMWCNWYKFNLWVLWVRATDPEKICIFKTTMLVESHWKVIKRNYLPRFFRPRLDLVTFIIITCLLSHSEAMYNKYKSGREKVSWRKEFKKCWKNLAKQEFSGKLYYTNTDQWICSCLAFLNNSVQRQGIYPLLGMVSEEQNYFNGTLLNKVAGEKRSEGEMEGTNITKGAEDTEDVEGVEEVERMKENKEQKFQEIESYLDQAISIVCEQHALNNYKWIKANFDGV
ncbi:hypothetical protein RirG_073390 [Rhizophagus irregularis DAOM 197198w]|uniref:Uncharacterized protein n=4 Tax=Rhizophagus irregularis TaxID=588596 RepID=A0A015JR40_RHIIW|nr:hypothetical protein RirG_073390 [Rhizophagus irregularis DAOM 197198w]